MGRISTVEKQKRNKNRVNVYIDGEYGGSLGVETVVKHRIREGREISPDELTAVFTEDNGKYAFDIAIKYIAYRARTKKQVVEHLEKKGITPAAVENTIEKLTDYGYIDDRTYAEDFVRQAVSSGKYGKQNIRYKLRKKGIADEVIDCALVFFTDRMEREQAERLYDKLDRKYAGEPEQKKSQKIYRSMVRKGFPYDVAAALVRQKGNDG